jgi:hypothetical protein
VLQALLGTLGPAWAGRLRQRTRPNPYAPTLPGQAGVASLQATRGELRPGTSGLAGSEADYYSDPQGIGTIGHLDALAQDLTSRALPPSTFVAGDPGADGQPLLNRDMTTGPIRRLSNAEGANTRTFNHPGQHVVASTLNPPGARTPTPREIAAARATGAPQGEQDALASYWS